MHKETHLEEQLKRLESELRLEKGQHQDHLEMLEDTLKQISSYKQYIERLVAMKSDLEAQIIVLEQQCLNGRILEKMIGFY